MSIPRHPPNLHRLQARVRVTRLRCQFVRIGDKIAVDSGTVAQGITAAMVIGIRKIAERYRSNV